MIDCCWSSLAAAAIIMDSSCRRRRRRRTSSVLVTFVAGLLAAFILCADDAAARLGSNYLARLPRRRDISNRPLINLFRSAGRFSRSPSTTIGPLLHQDAVVVDVDEIIRQPSIGDTYERKKLVVESVVTPPKLLLGDDLQRLLAINETVIQYEFVQLRPGGGLSVSVSVSDGDPHQASSSSSSSSASTIGNKYLLLLTNSHVRCFVHVPSDNTYLPLPTAVATVPVPYATKMAVTKTKNRFTGEELVYCAIAQAEPGNPLENRRLTFYLFSELGLTRPEEQVMHHPFQNFLFLDSPDISRNPILTIIERDPSTFDLKWAVEFAEIRVEADNSPSVRPFDEFLVDQPARLATTNIRGTSLVAIDSAKGYLDVGVLSKTGLDVVMLQHLVVAPLGSDADADAGTVEPIIGLEAFKYRSMPILAVSFKARTVFYAYDAGSFFESHTVAAFPDTEITGLKSVTFTACAEGLLYVRSVVDTAAAAAHYAADADNTSSTMTTTTTTTTSGADDENDGQLNNTPPESLEFWRLYFVQDQLTSEWLNVTIDCNKGLSAADGDVACDVFHGLKLDRSSAASNGTTVELALVHDGDVEPIVVSIKGDLMDVADPALVTVKEDSLMRDAISHKASEALKLALDIKTSVDACVRNASDVIGDDYINFDGGSSFVDAMDVTGTVHALDEMQSPNVAMSVALSPSAILTALKSAVGIATTALDSLEAKLMTALARIAGTLTVESLAVVESMTCDGRSFVVPGQLVPLIYSSSSGDAADAASRLVLANKLFVHGLDAADMNVTQVNGVLLDDTIASLGQQLKDGLPTTAQLWAPEGVALTVRDSIVFRGDTFNGKHQATDIVSSVVYNKTSEVVEFPFSTSGEIAIRSLSVNDVLAHVVGLGGSSNVREVFMIPSETQVVSAPATFQDGRLALMDKLEVATTINEFNLAAMENVGVRCDDSTSAIVLSDANLTTDVTLARILELNQHSVSGIAIPGTWGPNSPNNPFEAPVTADLLTVSLGDLSVNSPEVNKEMMKFLEDRVKLRSTSTSTSTEYEAQLVSTHMNLTDITSPELRFAHFWDFPPTRLLEKFLRKNGKHNITGLSSFKRVRAATVETSGGVSDLKLSAFFPEAIFPDRPTTFNATVQLHEPVTVNELRATRVQNVDLREANASLCFVTAEQCVFVDTAGKVFDGSFTYANPTSELRVIHSLNQKPVENLLTNATGREFVMTGLWRLGSGPSSATTLPGAHFVRDVTIEKIVGTTSNEFTMLTLKALAGVNGNAHLQGISVNGATTFKYPIAVTSDLACNTINGKPLGPALIDSRIDLTAQGSSSTLNMLLRLDANAALKGPDSFITVRHVNGQDWVTTVSDLFLNNAPSALLQLLTTSVQMSSSSSSSITADIQAPQVISQLRAAGSVVVTGSIHVDSQVHGVPASSLPCIRLDQPTPITDSLRLDFRFPVDVDSSNLQVAGSLQGQHTQVPPSSLIRIPSPCPAPPYDENVVGVLDIGPQLLMGKASVTAGAGGQLSVKKVNGIENLQSTLDHLVRDSSPDVETITGQKTIGNHSLRALDGLNVTRVCPADPVKCAAHIGCHAPFDFISINPPTTAAADDDSYTAGGGVRIPGPIKLSKLTAQDLTMATADGFVNDAPAKEPIDNLLYKNRPVSMNGNWVIAGPLEMMSCGGGGGDEQLCDPVVYLGSRSVKDVHDKVQAVRGKLEEKATRLERDLQELCHTWALITRGAGGKLEVLDSFQKRFRSRGFLAPITSVVLFEAEGRPNLMVCSNGVPAPTSAPSLSSSSPTTSSSEQQQQQQQCQHCLLFAADDAEYVDAERGTVAAAVSGVVKDMDSIHFQGKLVLATVAEPSPSSLFMPATSTSTSNDCPTGPRLSICIFQDATFKVMGSVDLPGSAKKVVLKLVGNQLRAFVAVAGGPGDAVASIIAYQVDMDFALGSATLQTVGAPLPSSGKFAVDVLWPNDEPLALTVTEDAKGVVLSVYNTYGNPLTTVPSNTSYPAASAICTVPTPFGPFAALAIPGTQQQIPVKSTVQIIKMRKDAVDGWHVNKYHALDVSGNPIHVGSFFYSAEAAYVVVGVEKELIEVIQTKGASGFGKILDINLRGVSMLTSNVTLGNKDVYFGAWTEDRSVHVYRSRMFGQSSSSSSTVEGDVCRAVLSSTTTATTTTTMDVQNNGDSGAGTDGAVIIADDANNSGNSSSTGISSDVTQRKRQADTTTSTTSSLATALPLLMARWSSESGLDAADEATRELVLRLWIMENMNSAQVTEQVLDILSARGQTVQTSVTTDLKLLGLVITPTNTPISSPVDLHTLDKVAGALRALQSSGYKVAVVVTPPQQAHRLPLSPDDDEDDELPPPPPPPPPPPHAVSSAGISELLAELGVDTPGRIKFLVASPFKHEDGHVFSLEANWE